MEIRKTKIVATIGPVSESKEMVQKLVKAGVTVARLNFSHGDYESHQRKIDTIHSVIDDGANLAIMLDTKGPEIRTGCFEYGQAEFKKGNVVHISMKEILGNQERFSVSYPNLYDDLKVDDIIRIDDGRLGLKIIDKDSEHRELIAVVMNNHKLTNRKSVVAPGITLNIPYMSKKDKEDIVFGCRNDIAFIAASFTRTAEDILQIRSILKAEHKEHIQVIAKIENKAGYQNARKILEVADGIIVARGDLGVEVAPEEVPIMQKNLVTLARSMGKMVIIATHMLDSMQYNPTPTRAEVNDVANAVFDACDGIMLSGESASGKYPIEAAKMEAKIARRAEEVLDYHRMADDGFDNSNGDQHDAVAFSVASTVLLSKAKLIVCYSRSGATAKRVAYYRPKCPIVSISTDKNVKPTLCLTWGVYGYYVPSYKIEDMEKIAIKAAREYGLKDGDQFVLTGGSGNGTMNFMKIIEITSKN